MDSQGRQSAKDSNEHNEDAPTSARLPDVFNMSAPISSFTSNVDTISSGNPFLQGRLTLTPNPTGFGTFTSPSAYEASPENGGSYSLAHNIGSNYFDSADSFVWQTPVLHENIHPQPADVSTATNPPFEITSDNIEVAQPASSGREPTNPASSPNGSRGHNNILPSAAANDATDKVAMKRARNTMAVRRFRERKAQELKELEDTVARLEAERDYWKNLALSRTGEQSG